MLLSLFLLHQLIGYELLSSSTFGVTKPPATAVCVELRNTLFTTSFHHAIFRYIMIDTLRHISVLSHIYQAFKEHLDSQNQNKLNKSSPNSILFVKAGSTPQLNQMLSRKITKTHLLSKGTDWNLLVDLPGHNYVFPPEIYATSERPDIVIWSLTLHQAYIIELTCPAEEGIQTAAMRKVSKYTPLVENISRETNWKIELFTIEVGARGFIATSTKSVLAKFGFPFQKLNSLQTSLSNGSKMLFYHFSSSKLKVLG